MENKELQILYKNNLLIKSSYNLKLVENRFYLTILFNMQKTNSGNYNCMIPKNDFIKLIKNSTQKRKSEVEKILTTISDRYIEILEYKNNNKKKEYKYHIINGFDYDESTDSYHIELSTTLYDLIISYMEGGYTPLNLGVLLGLNNYYAQRFYELLRLWSGTKTKINYTVEHIRDCLQLKDKYPNFAHLKAKVLDPSIKALNDSECFNIGYKEIKEGRKVVSVDFFVEDLETRTYYLSESQDIKDEIETKHLVSKIPDTIKESEMVENKPILISDKSIMDIDKLDLSEMKKPVQRLFKKDFKDYDFSIKYISESLDFAISVVMEKDDVEILGTRQYPIFKKIFLAMIQKGEKLDLDEFASNIENEMFW